MHMAADASLLQMKGLVLGFLCAKILTFTIFTAFKEAASQPMGMLNG